VVAARVDATVVLTQQDEHDLEAYLGEHRVRIVTIPNALSWPARPVQPPDRKVVLGAGRLMDQKDFATLVTAFGGVAQQHRDWQLHIWGEGPLERPLRRQVRELGLQRQVKLKGYSTQFRKTLRTGSILAMTSKYEGLPMVLLEAMSRGLAPVSFGELIPAREVIIDDVNGVLVEPRMPEAMGEALSALMSDPARRRRLGEQAVQTAQNYDMSRIGPRWDELFDDLVRRRTTPGQARRSGVTA
jgi:glycosyltransferase involved in cell wall biosynthesis